MKFQPQGRSAPDSAYLHRPGVAGGREMMPVNAPASGGNPLSFWRGGYLLSLLCLYALVLHWTYSERIAPLFSYLGQRYRTPDPLNFAIAFGLAYLTLLLLPKKLVRPSDFVLWVIYVMAVVPSILVPQFADIASVPASLTLAFFVALTFSLVIVISGIGPAWTVESIRTPVRLPWVPIWLFSVAFYAYMLNSTGWNLQFVSLLQVQDVRFQYRETISNLGPALAYGISIQGYVINPILLARGIYARKWGLLTAGTVGQLLIYSVTGYKLVILAVPAALALALMFKWSKKSAGHLILAGVLLSSTLALAYDWVAGGYGYTQLFVNRLLLTPGTLSAAYVSVFQDKQNAEWGYSFLAPFVDYPYATSPAFIVGAEFTGDPRTSANANLFADGYANLGYAGTLVEGLVLVFLLWMVNVAGSHLAPSVSAIVLLVPAMALVNTSVFTSFLTGGFVVAAVVMAFLPSAGWHSRATTSSAPFLKLRRGRSPQRAPS